MGAPQTAESAATAQALLDRCRSTHCPCDRHAFEMYMRSYASAWRICVFQSITGYIIFVGSADCPMLRGWLLTASVLLVWNAYRVGSLFLARDR